MKSDGGDKLDTTLWEALRALRPAGRQQKRKESASADSKKKIPPSTSENSKPETRQHPAQDPCPLDLEDDPDYPPMLHRYKRQKFKDLNLLLRTEPPLSLAKTLDAGIGKYYQRRKRTNTEKSSPSSGSEVAMPEQKSWNGKARELEKNLEPKASKETKLVKSEGAADGNGAEGNPGVPKLGSLLHQCEDPANCQSACVARELLPRLDHLTDEELIYGFQQVTGEMFVRRPGEKVRGRIRRVIRAEAKKICSAASSDQAKCVSSDVGARLPTLESSPSSLCGGLIRQDDSLGQLVQETSLTQEEAGSENKGCSAHSTSSVALAATKDCGVSSEERSEDGGRGLDNLQSVAGQEDAQVAKPICWMVVKREIAESAFEGNAANYLPRAVPCDHTPNRVEVAAAETLDSSESSRNPSAETAKEELQVPSKAQMVAYSVEEHSEPSPNSAIEKEGRRQPQDCDGDGLICSQGNPSSQLHGERCQTAGGSVEDSLEVTSNAQQFVICRLNRQFQEEARSTCSLQTTTDGSPCGLPETSDKEEPEAAAASLLALDAIPPEISRLTTQQLDMEVGIEPELELEAEPMPTAQKPEKISTIVLPELEMKPETRPETQEPAREPKLEFEATPSIDELEPEIKAEPMTTHQEPELETATEPELTTRFQESEVEREFDTMPTIQEKDQEIDSQPTPRNQESEVERELDPILTTQEEQKADPEPAPGIQESEVERELPPMPTIQEKEQEIDPEPAPGIQESEVERELPPMPAIQEKEQEIDPEPAPGIQESEVEREFDPMPTIQEKEQEIDPEPAPGIQESEVERELPPMPAIQEKEQEIDPEPAPGIQESEVEREFDPMPTIQEKEQEIDPELAPGTQESEVERELDPMPTIQEKEQTMDPEPAPGIQESEVERELDPMPATQEKEQEMDLEPMPNIQESEVGRELDLTPTIQEPKQKMVPMPRPRIQEPELEIGVEPMHGLQEPEVVMEPESASPMEESEPELNSGSEQQPLAFQFHSPDPNEKMEAELSDRKPFGDCELNRQSESFSIPDRFSDGDALRDGWAGSSDAQSPETTATILQARSINNDLRKEGEEISDYDRAEKICTKNEEHDPEEVADGDLSPECQGRTTSVELHEDESSCCLGVTGVTTVSCPAASEKSGSVPGLESPSVSSEEFVDAREDLTDASENSQEMMVAREYFTDASEDSHETMMMEVEVSSQSVVPTEVMDEDGPFPAGAGSVAKVEWKDDQRELGGRGQVEGYAALEAEDGPGVQDAVGDFPEERGERLRELGQVAWGSFNDDVADVISESPGELISSGDNAGNSESTAVCASIAPTTDLLKRGAPESVEEETRTATSENKLGVTRKDEADEVNGQSLRIRSRDEIMANWCPEVVEGPSVALEEADERAAGYGASEMDCRCSSVEQFGREMPKLIQEEPDRLPGSPLEENELQEGTEQLSNTAVGDVDGARDSDPCLEALRSDLESGPNAESGLQTSGASHPEWIADHALCPLELPSDTAMEDVSTSGDAQVYRFAEINGGTGSRESQHKDFELAQAGGISLERSRKYDSGCGANCSLVLLEQAETSSEHPGEDLLTPNPEVSISVPQATSRLETQDSASAEVQDLESVAISRQSRVAQYRPESIGHLEEPCCTSGGVTWETRESSCLMARERISESFASQLSLEHPESESQVGTAAERATEEEDENNPCSNGDNRNDSLPPPPERKGSSKEDESQGSRNEKVHDDEEEMARLESDETHHPAPQTRKHVEEFCHLERSDEALLQESQQRSPSEVASAEEGEEDRMEVAEGLDCSGALSLPSSQESVMICGVELLYSSSTPWDDLLQSESRSHDNDGFSVEAQELVELGPSQPVVVACIDEDGIKLDRISQSFDFDVHDEWLDAGGKHPETVAAAEFALTASLLEKEQVDEDEEHGSPKKRKLCDGSQSQVQLQSPERLAVGFRADINLGYGRQHETPSSSGAAEDELNGAHRSLKSSLAVAGGIAGGSTGSEQSPRTAGSPAGRKLRSTAKQRHAAATVSRCQRLSARNERKSQALAPRARKLKGVMTALREKARQPYLKRNEGFKPENIQLISWRGQELAAAAAPAEVLECSESYPQMKMEVLESDSCSNSTSGVQQNGAVVPGELIPESPPLNCLQSEDTRMASPPLTSESVDQFDEHGPLQHLMPHLEPPSKLLRARKTISPTSRRELLRASSSGIYPLPGDSPQKTLIVGVKQTPRSGISFDKVPRSGGRRLFSTPSLPTTSTPCATQDEAPPLQLRISPSVDERARHPESSSSSSPSSSFRILHANGIISSPSSSEFPRKISLSLSPFNVRVKLPQPSCPVASPPHPSGAPAPALSPAPAQAQAQPFMPAPAQAPAQVKYKGILKSSPKSCAGLCKCPKCSEARFREGKGAAEFIAVQMKAFMNISRQLTKEVQGLRAMVETHAANAENLKEVQESLQKSRDVELSIDKNIVRVLRDSRRMCKLINEKSSARRIVFADEAGKALCHIKTFQS